MVSKSIAPSAPLNIADFSIVSPQFERWNGSFSKTFQIISRHRWTGQKHSLIMGQLEVRRNVQNKHIRRRDLSWPADTEDNTAFRTRCTVLEEGLFSYLSKSTDTNTSKTNLQWDEYFCTWIRKKHLKWLEITWFFLIEVQRYFTQLLKLRSNIPNLSNFNLLTYIIYCCGVSEVTVKKHCSEYFSSKCSRKYRYFYM